MKKSFVIFFILLFIVSCEKESHPDLRSIHDANKNDLLALRSPAPKIDVCHYDPKSNSWTIININENAWSAHANHGDIRLDDQDNDGYVPNNNCNFGIMGDCDDLNANLNPGSSEICFNGLDDDCNGLVDEMDLSCPRDTI